jgi:hypothetical protein
MYYYTIKPDNIDNWYEKLVCGYVFKDPGVYKQKIDDDNTHGDPSTKPTKGVPRQEIVDLFSKTNDSMHFWGAPNDGDIVNLMSAENLWNRPISAFYTPPNPNFETVAMVRFFHQVNNSHIFTTLQNDVDETEYNRHGYYRNRTMFHIFRSEYGNIDQCVPLFRWRHGF